MGSTLQILRVMAMQKEKQTYSQTEGQTERTSVNGQTERINIQKEKHTDRRIRAPE